MIRIDVTPRPDSTDWEVKDERGALHILDNEGEAISLALEIQNNIPDSEIHVHYEGREDMWTPKDATKHTKKANTPKKQRQWKDVANSVKSKGGTDKSAIMQADAVVGKTAKNSKKKAK